MDEERADRTLGSARVLIIALVVVIIALGIAVVLLTIGQSPQTSGEVERANALADSTDECVTCHRRATPGIVSQYGASTMAAAEVGCRDCHEVDAGYPGAVEHEGTHVLNEPTTAMCRSCHQQQVAQFNQSRHSLPAYVAYAGADGLSEEHLQMYESIPEGQYNPDQTRNALYAMEGQDVTRFACESCHNIGEPKPDGSVGECQKCHLRHEFSLEQARKPETCNACHIGPDHPQWEIYHESPHGIAYKTGGDRWNWHAEAGTLSVEDFPAPTCATCHMSGFGASGTTHDVGDRLTWYLFAPVSERRPSWQDNRTRMQNVCRECHNETFLTDFYEAADRATEAVNDWVREGQQILEPLKESGYMTPEPFDQTVDFEYFELWHHWGRTAKFGAWMQGADYVQWHGAYEILGSLQELRDIVDEHLDASSDAE